MVSPSQPPALPPAPTRSALPAPEGVEATDLRRTDRRRMAVERELAARLANFDSVAMVLSSSSYGSLRHRQRDLRRRWREAVALVARIERDAPGSDLHERALRMLTDLRLHRDPQPGFLRTLLLQCVRLMPIAFWRARFEIAVSLLVFLAAIGLGASAGAQDPEFTEAFLPQSYMKHLEMLGEAIREGDDAHYNYIEPGSERGLFGIQLAGNNIMVAAKCVAGGVLLGLYTLFTLVYNGLHVGAFLGYSHSVGASASSYEWIAAHGPLELSAIVLAGGAGLRIGTSFLLPGARSRLASMAIAGRDVAALVLFISACLGMAALLESHVSPTRVSMAMRITLGLVGGLLIWGPVALWCTRSFEPARSVETQARGPGDG